MKDDERAFLIAVANRPEVTYREWLERRISASHPALAHSYRQQLISPFANLNSMVPEESVGDVGALLGIHPKRVDYLCLKWSARGWYDYGTSVGTGWLTDEGKDKAANI